PGELCAMELTAARNKADSVPAGRRFRVSSGMRFMAMVSFVLQDPDCRGLSCRPDEKPLSAAGRIPLRGTATTSGEREPCACGQTAAAWGYNGLLQRPNGRDG